MKQILLNRGKSLRSSNVDNNVSTELFTEQKLLPTDSLSSTVDAYAEYIKEKDASEVYRLLFTINPVCSNILFNAQTEIVYKEGSDETKVLTSADTSISAFSNGNLSEYATKYKELQTINRGQAMRDTAISHPEIGNFSYHCGIDIFNNHTLRRRELAVVNDISSLTARAKGDFNTLSDYMRDSQGNIVEERILKMLKSDGNEDLNKNPIKMHLYTMDSVDSFQRTVNGRLTELDGWLGFTNPASLSIPNVTLGDEKYTINKCINNRAAGEFIDMYPDRTLYSFLPKINDYRKRIEKNWDYCLTYPYESVFDSPIIQNGAVNGIKCKVISSLSKTIFDKVENGIEGEIVYLRTQVRNTFIRGTQINITVQNGGDSAETYYPITVETIGISGEDGAHIFGVRVGDLYNVFSRLSTETFLDGDGYLFDTFDIRVRKFVNSIDCQYYFRKFKKLPEYSSTVNKAAFSENIFSDRIAQIMFNDDIITTGLKDNLGRKLSELYLTIIKRNAGYKEWLNKNYASENVEYSHCFGNVTSGLDLVPDEKNYNVHKLHNNSAQTPEEIAYLETDITVDDDEFLGDLVEFSPYTLTETVLEDVYHRFNTIQREAGVYAGGIEYDNIYYDDFDISSGFTTTTTALTIASKCSEGYYYKPHYRVPLRQYSETVNQGTHKKLVFQSLSPSAGNSFSGVTSVNYYIYPGDILYLYDRKTGDRIEGEITSVTGKNLTEVVFALDDSVEDIKKYAIFKKNPIMPDYAYDLMDASGRYLWKEELSDKDLTLGDELFDSIFTNGANYRHLKINFYLRRQDPTAECGLNTVDTVDTFSGAAEGKIKDYEDVEVVTEAEGTVC